MTIHSIIHALFAAPAQADIDAARHELMRQPADRLGLALKRLAEKGVNRVAAKPIGSDPLLGDLSPIVSVGGKIQINHGKDLPTALGLILEARGLRVWHQPKVGLTAPAIALAEDNTIEDCARLKLGAPRGDRRIYRPDLIVHCEKTGWTLALEGKRGGGASDSTARNEATVNVRAAYLSLPQWAREQGLQPSQCDARIVDFLGGSAFADELLLSGWQLDAYFGCPVEEAIALYSAHMHLATQRLLRPLIGSKPAADIAPELLAERLRVRAPDGIRQRLEQPQDLFADRLVADEDRNPADLYSRPDKSLAAARNRHALGNL
jgi:hypothetical protein